MATNGILLGQNNDEGYLKKEIFFISDPITIHRTYGDKQSSLATTWLLPEEATEYSQINFGIYDGNYSVKLTTSTKNSDKTAMAYISCYGVKFYICKAYSSNTSDVIKTFTYSKNRSASIILFSEGDKYSGQFLGYSYSSDLSSFDDFYLYTTLSTTNSSDYLDLSVRFYLEGIK